MSIDSYGIHIGFLYLRFYGIIIMAGVLAATFLARWMFNKMGEDGEMGWDALIWALIFGVIGARLYHVLTPSKYSGITPAYYLENPIRILTTWEGGLGIPGAVAGGALGVYIFARRRNVSFGMLGDAVAPGLALAQAIGRWGNYVNRELFGGITDLPWGIQTPMQILPPQQVQDIQALADKLGFEAPFTFHPLFLYESLYNLLNAGVLLFLWSRYREKMKDGDLFLIYLIIYPLGRFILEYLRLDYVDYFGVNFNQMFMLVIAIVSAVFLFLRHRPIKRSSAA